MVFEIILRGALYCIGALLVLGCLKVLYSFPPLLIVLAVIAVASLDNRRHI